MLTVSRLAAQRAMEAAQENNCVEFVLEEAIRAGEVTLAETVEMNPVLKKAGVVDAGGKGYLIILDGMLRCLRGEAIPEVTEETAVKEKADFAALEDEITFTFDTVFIVRKTMGEKSLEPLRAYLDSIGDSLVIGEMKEAARLLQFEHAAFLRDEIEKLQRGEDPTADTSTRRAAEKQRKTGKGRRSYKK